MLPDTLEAKWLFEESHRCRPAQRGSWKLGMGTRNSRRVPRGLWLELPLRASGGVVRIMRNSPLKPLAPCLPCGKRSKDGICCFSRDY